jgi:hypothetical protein
MERDRHLIVFVVLGGLAAPALQALFGLTQRLPSALARAQMLRQPVTALARP